MKKSLFLIFIFLLFACDSEDANDCIKTTGSVIQQEYFVSEFSKILVNRDIELIVSEGSTYQIIVETGKNLMRDIEVIVNGNELKITDNNGCNLFRDYISTKVYVTTPILTEIRNSSQYTVSSRGVLNFPNLNLTAEDFNSPDSFAVGDFNLEVQSQELRINSNNVSSFYLTGETEALFIAFYAGDGRFQGEALLAKRIEVFHRGSNDMFVHPLQSLTGELRGTGNLISVNEPSVVNVDQFYTGKLIFQ